MDSKYGTGAGGGGWTIIPKHLKIPKNPKTLKPLHTDYLPDTGPSGGKSLPTGLLGCG